MSDVPQATSYSGTLSPSPTGGAGPTHIRTSPFAIASLVFSLFICCCGVNGVLAILLGGVALWQIHRGSSQYTGSGLAMAGISLGALSVAAMVLFVGFMALRYQSVRPTAEAVTREIQEGRFVEAKARFSRTLRSNPEFDAELVTLRDALNSRGRLVELGIGDSIQVNNSVTTATFAGVFERGDGTITCSFLQEDGEWRLTAYSVRF